MFSRCKAAGLLTITLINLYQLYNLNRFKKTPFKSETTRQSCKLKLTNCISYKSNINTEIANLGVNLNIEIEKLADGFEVRNVSR